MTEAEAASLNASIMALPERIAAELARVMGYPGGARLQPGGGQGGQGGLSGRGNAGGAGQPDLYGATQGLAGALGNFLPGFSKIASLMGQIRQVADAAGRFGDAISWGGPEDVEAMDALPAPKTNEEWDKERKEKDAEYRKAWDDQNAEKIARIEAEFAAASVQQPVNDLLAEEQARIDAAPVEPLPPEPSAYDLMSQEDQQKSDRWVAMSRQMAEDNALHAPRPRSKQLLTTEEEAAAREELGLPNEPGVWGMPKRQVEEEAAVLPEPPPTPPVEEAAAAEPAAPTPAEVEAAVLPTPPPTDQEWNELQAEKKESREQRRLEKGGWQEPGQGVLDEAMPTLPPVPSASIGEQDASGAGLPYQEQEKAAATEEAAVLPTPPEPVTVEEEAAEVARETIDPKEQRRRNRLAAEEESFAGLEATAEEAEEVVKEIDDLAATAGKPNQISMNEEESAAFLQKQPFIPEDTSALPSYDEAPAHGKGGWPKRMHLDAPYHDMSVADQETAALDTGASAGDDLPGTDEGSDALLEAAAALVEAAKELREAAKERGGVGGVGSGEKVPADKPGSPAARAAKNVLPKVAGSTNDKAADLALQTALTLGRNLLAFG